MQPPSRCNCLSMLAHEVPAQPIAFSALQLLLLLSHAVLLLLFVTASTAMATATT